MAAVRREVADGARELARRDGVLRRMLERHGPPDLGRGHPRRGHFAQLARMICYQQLAGSAARAIHGRFAALYDGAPTPAAVAATPPEALRAAGLSAAKAASVLDLARKVDQGLVRLEGVARLDDDEVVRELTAVRGIGEWTAQMFLMFQLGRLDVWPTLDLGVRTGYARMFGLSAAPTPKELGPEGERFRPYRSLVAWWCWRAVDTQVPG